MNISSKQLYNDQNNPIYIYTLTNSQNLSCSILNYGATIMSINFKDSNNKLRNLALGFDTFDTYIKNSLYSGASLGPNAGRISKGNLQIESEVFHLSHNDNMNNLHGGFNNISFQTWQYVKETCNEASVSLTLSLTLADGEDGFPGNRTLYATFTLTKDDELKIKYEGTTDKATYLNLSNHCYFNLTGDFNTSVLEHKLTIAAAEYLENDETHCANNLSSVVASPFDFRNSTQISENITAFKEHPQLLFGKGYNNGFILNPSRTLDNSTPALILKSPKEDLTLELFTDAPALVLYTGGYIEEGLQIEKDSMTKANCALAIEPQDYPNGPNLPFVKTSILHKNEKYERNIVYRIKKETLSDFF